MNNFDWQWWRYFLAIAEHGSVSKASEVLAVAQPTLSRQLLAMEKTLGQALFDRSTKGLTLTKFGASLLEDSQAMQNSEDRLQRLIQGQEQQLNGRVRVSANELIGLYYLPLILPTFMDRFPQLGVEIEITNKASSLDKRDADIAIRMFPPTQQDLVSRHLFDIPLGFYASKGYIKRNGQPRNPAELFQHRVLGFDRDPQFIEGGRALGWSLKNEDFLLRCDFMPIHVAIAENDGGIVGSHKNLCDRKGLVEIDVGIELPSLPIYLVCHRDIQHNKSIRATMDYLADHLESCFDKQL